MTPGAVAARGCFLAYWLSEPALAAAIYCLPREKTALTPSSITARRKARDAREYVQRERVELFKRMVFNILVTNNDDHLRNHAFLYTAIRAAGCQGRSMMSSPPLSSARSTSSTWAARLDNAPTGAGRFGIQRRAAARIIEALVERVRTWRNTFDACGVSEADSDAVAGAFRRVCDIGFAEVERAGRT